MPFQEAHTQVVEPNGNPWLTGHQTVMSECVIDGVRTFIMATSPSLITRIEEECKLRHYSPRTAAAYSHWTRQYYRFHGRRPPRELGAEHIQSFLTHLAVRKFSASSQNQALNALFFVYDKVLRLPLGDFSQFVRAPRPRRLPVVLSVEEVQRLLAQMQGLHKLMAQLIYGTGLRLHECLTLRVQDLDFAHGRVVVRQGKGGKDRLTILPDCLREPLQAHLQWRLVVHQRDLALGAGHVFLPGRLSVKYPNASREFLWQYVFASAVVQQGYRWHCGDTALQRAIKLAGTQARIHKRVGCHTLRQYAALLIMPSWTVRSCESPANRAL